MSNNKREEDRVQEIGVAIIKISFNYLIFNSRQQPAAAAYVNMTQNIDMQRTNANVEFFCTLCIDE